MSGESIEELVALVPWIKNGKCINNGDYICNLGWACDGCPYNKDGDAKAKQPVDEKPEPRKCCACKKEKKIVNIGGPPLCSDCFDLASNWSEALEKQHKYFRALIGFKPETDFECGIADVDYFLEQIAEDIADAHMKLRQAEVNLANIRTTVRADTHWERGDKTKDMQFCINCTKKTLFHRKGKPGSIRWYCSECGQEQGFSDDP